MSQQHDQFQEDEILPLQVTGCTGGDFQLYNDVERAVECAIGSEGPGVGPLGQSVRLASIANRPPLSCMIDLVTGPSSDCGTEIPPDRRQAAFDTFSNITGFRPANLGFIFNQVTHEQRELLNIQTFYMFFPLFILSLLAIWLLVGFGWMSWPIGLFLSALVFLIIYGFSLLYRMQANNFLDNQDTIWENEVVNVQDNFEDTVAYWPQGLFGVACSVTSTGGTGWVCNNGDDCPGCPECPQSTNTCSGKCPGRNSNKTRRRKAGKEKERKRDGKGMTVAPQRAVLTKRHKSRGVK